MRRRPVLQLDREALRVSRSKEPDDTGHTPAITTDAPASHVAVQSQRLFSLLGQYDDEDEDANSNSNHNGNEQSESLQTVAPSSLDKNAIDQQKVEDFLSQLATAVDNSQPALGAPTNALHQHTSTTVPSTEIHFAETTETAHSHNPLTFSKKDEDTILKKLLDLKSAIEEQLHQTPNKTDAGIISGTMLDLYHTIAENKLIRARFLLDIGIAYQSQLKEQQEHTDNDAKVQSSDTFEQQCVYAVKDALNPPNPRPSSSSLLPPEVSVHSLPIDPNISRFMKQLPVARTGDLDLRSLVLFSPNQMDNPTNTDLKSLFAILPIDETTPQSNLVYRTLGSGYYSVTFPDRSKMEQLIAKIAPQLFSLLQQQHSTNDSAIRDWFLLKQRQPSTASMPSETVPEALLPQQQQQQQQQQQFVFSRFANASDMLELYQVCCVFETSPKQGGVQEEYFQPPTLYDEAAVSVFLSNYGTDAMMQNGIDSENTALKSVESIPVVSHIEEDTRTLHKVPTFPKSRGQSEQMTSMFQQWKTTGEGVIEKEEEDPHERKKRRRIDEWKNEQHSSKLSANNANFQPLGVNRLQQRTGSILDQTNAPPSSTLASKSPSATTTQAPSNSKADLLREASRGLPPHWKAFFDEKSGKIYFGNRQTKLTMWTRPTS